MRLVVGLTGSIGSGCSTLGISLNKLGFEVLSLSDIVKNEWENQNPGKRAEDQAKKFELQDIGNKFRETHGDNYLALETIKQAEKKTNEPDLVFDSIRHTGEVDSLRNKYPNFILIGVDCPIDDRWKRVRPKYQSQGLTKDDFETDNSRDKNEAEDPHGQQVELCVDEADVFIDNEKDCYNEKVAVRTLKKKITPYIDLIRGEKLRHPLPREEYMSIAYTASLISQCYKRQVGAVIVDAERDAILATGYNENPSPTKPCIEEYTKCRRDLYRENYFEKLEKSGVLCPHCKNPIRSVSSTYKCTCGYDLEKFFIPDRAVSQCTALHAEQRALMGLGRRNAEGTTLYATTYPCAKCASDIVEAKIGRVIYVSAYPDPLAVKIFLESGIPTDRFEGVKARAYFQLFGSWRKETENTFLRE